MNFFERSLLSLVTFLTLINYSSTTKPSIPDDKCTMCSTIAGKFLQGISRTSKLNFGGGNTRWEEENLGKYVFSETRFIEIVEKICVDEKKECHQMLEVHEELLEKWWKQFYAQRIESDLKEYLCVRRLKVCCPRGTYGPDCKDCDGGRNNPCNRNGKCDGDGTKKGTGECKCDVGYEGILCHVCTDGFYDNNPEFQRTKASENPFSYRPICIPCHASCKLKCKGQGPEGCHTCKDGWIMMEGGCADLNECEDESMCPLDEYCINTEGSYKCSACHKACRSCTGLEVRDCITCSVRHFRNHNNTCTACHESCAKSCKDESPGSCDQCKKGWRVDENGICQDIDECQSPETPLRCSDDEYCVNSIGSYKCSTCHPNCNGCHGAGIDKCLECREGYQITEDGSCVDVDECQKPDEACPGSNKKCINLPGGYRCDCIPGFKLQGGLCVHSSRATNPDSDKDPTIIHGSSHNNQKKNFNEAKKIKKQKKVPLYKRDFPQYLMRLCGFTVACSITKRKLFLQSAVTIAFASYLYYYASELDGSYTRE